MYWCRHILIFPPNVITSITKKNEIELSQVVSQKLKDNRFHAGSNYVSMISVFYNCFVNPPLPEFFFHRFFGYNLE